MAAHTGSRRRSQRAVLDEQGRLYLETDLGFGLVHTLDVAQAADAIEQGLWVPEEMTAARIAAALRLRVQPGRAAADDPPT